MQGCSPLSSQNQNALFPKKKKTGETGELRIKFFENTLEFLGFRLPLEIPNKTRLYP